MLCFHCLQGNPPGQGADHKRTHIPRVYVALGVVPVSLPQRRLGCGHHSRRCDALHQKARQMPEGSEERGQRGGKQFPGSFIEARGLRRRVTELRSEYFKELNLTLCCLHAVPSWFGLCVCVVSQFLAVKRVCRWSLRTKTAQACVADYFPHRVIIRMLSLRAQSSQEHLVISHWSKFRPDVSLTVEC